jgi:hypothetical protein
VEWVDSGTFYTGEGWSTKETIIREAKIGTVITVGWLFHEDDDNLYICTSWDKENDHYYGTQVILKRNIIKRVTLRER